MKSVLPADTFIVVNKTTLSDKDRNLLMLLYQPIVGSSAISLYYTLWSYLDKSELISKQTSIPTISPICTSTPLIFW